MTMVQQPMVRGQRKTRLGLVVSNKMTKTISVQVVQLFRHPKYDRVIKRASRFKAHDETNSASVGDWVKIMETRPLSKDKRWRLVEIVKRTSNAPPVPQEEAVSAPAAEASRVPDAQGQTEGASQSGEGPGASKRTRSRRPRE